MRSDRPESARSRRLLVELFDRYTLPAMLFDAEGGLVYANRAAGELLELGGETASRMDELFEPRSQDSSELRARSTLLGERPFQRLALTACEHGLEGSIVFDPAHEAARTQEEVLEAMASLAGGVAHDFNNHLTAILSHADLAGLRLDQTDVARGHLEEIEDAARRARQLTQQLLAFSRRQVVHPRVLEVNEVARRARRVIRSMLGDRVQVRLALDEQAGSVRMDPRHLERLLVDVVRQVHLAQFVHGTRGCVVSTTRAGTERAEVELTVGAPGTRFAAPAVMGPHELRRITVLIEQSGGRLRVGDGGDALTLYLPSAVEEPTVAEPGREQGETTIWVVEDDDAVRSVIQAVLEREGYRVQSAENGPRALELASAGEAVELLVSDVRMPGMNGLDLYERLAPMRPGLKVLFVSGMVEDRTLRERLSGHGLAFLQKPFAARELAEKVRSVLAGKASPCGAERILIVDDEEGVRELVPRMLEGDDYECVLASSTAEALEWIDRKCFGLVLCDMVMPERDGFELLRELRARGSQARVIAMSGHKLAASSLAAARELGAVRTLNKPFSRDELLLALAQARPSAA